ncbi:MAG: extracellular solute-binding protein [Oscillospiraceae bacterium]
MKKAVGLILSLILILSMFAACAGNGANSESSAPDSQESAPPADSSPAEETASESEASAGTAADFAYPMDTDVTLTYFTIYNRTSETHEDYAETEYAKSLAARTGVEVKYITGTTEQFNIMAASNDTSDILEFPFTISYPGGALKAIADGVIVPLNDLAEHSPNLNKLLAENPECDKQVKTDDGVYFTFPFFRGDPALQTFQGPIIRQDWLDDLGLESPTTVDELEAVLTAFKDEKGATAPLSLLSSATSNGLPFLYQLIGGAYEIGWSANPNFFIDSADTVVFAPLTPNYKDFLAKLNNWYVKGLLDSSYGAIDQAALDSNMLNGISGVSVHNAGGGIGRWMDAKADDPSFQLAGFQQASMSEGTTPYTGQMENVFPGTTSASISTSCKNPDIAARWLDYGYSEEGHMFMNFGDEGVAYELVDGYPKYTDTVTKGEAGLAQTMAIYFRSNGGGQFVQDLRYLEQYMHRESQLNAVKLWAETDAEKHVIPPLSFTEEESSRLAKLTNDINILVDEKTTKYIIGAESLDSYEDFVSQLEDLGIRECLDIYAAAYQRYKAR